jgi:hypothetical protein
MERSMLWDKIGYAALCIVVPVAWGLLIYRMSNFIENRLFHTAKSHINNRRKTDKPTLPLDYHI